MQVKITRAVDAPENHPAPVYSSEGAAAFDLSATESKEVWCDGGTAVFKTGWHFQVPPGYAMFVVPRSGLGFKGIRLSNCIGVIDSDYRGEVLVKLTNDIQDAPGKFTGVKINAGDRIAQAFILPIEKAQFEIVGELDATIRGSSGFGSTGQ